MAETFTEIVAGLRDADSPWKQARIRNMRDNEIALQHRPFPFLWADVDPNENPREWTTTQTGTYLLWANSWNNLWIPPGVEEIHLVLNAQFTSGSGTGSVKLRLDPFNPTLSTRDSSVETFTAASPSSAVLTFDWTGTDVTELWDRKARVRFLAYISSGSGTIRLFENPDPRSYFRQAA